MFWTIFFFVFAILATLCFGFLFIFLTKEAFDEIFYSHDAFEWFGIIALPLLSLFAFIALIGVCIELYNLL